MMAFNERAARIVYKAQDHLNHLTRPGAFFAEMIEAWNTASSKIISDPYALGRFAGKLSLAGTPPDEDADAVSKLCREVANACEEEWAKRPERVKTPANFLRLVAGPEEMPDGTHVPEIDTLQMNTTIRALAEDVRANYPWMPEMGDPALMVFAAWPLLRAPKFHQAIALHLQMDLSATDAVVQRDGERVTLRVDADAVEGNLLEAMADLHGLHLSENDRALLRTGSSAAASPAADVDEGRALRMRILSDLEQIKQAKRDLPHHHSSPADAADAGAGGAGAAEGHSACDAKATPPPIPPDCAVCGKTTTTRCGRCGLWRFCSISCQRAAWDTHRITTCRPALGARLLARCGDIGAIIAEWQQWPLRQTASDNYPVQGKNMLHDALRKYRDTPGADADRGIAQNAAMLGFMDARCHVASCTQTERHANRPCTRCGLAFYCGDEHAKAAWPHHRRVCGLPHADISTMKNPIGPSAI